MSTTKKAIEVGHHREHLWETLDLTQTVVPPPPLAATLDSCMIASKPPPYPAYESPKDDQIQGLDLYGAGILRLCARATDPTSGGSPSSLIPTPPVSAIR